MMVELKTFLRSNQERIEFACSFLEQAILQGVDTNHPSQRPGKNWERDIRILKEYVQTPSLLERDMAVKYHLRSQEISRIIRVTMRRLWCNCSPETQRLFPLEKLLLRSRHKRSNSVETARTKVLEASL